MLRYSRRISSHVQTELIASRTAESNGDATAAFAHLERAHVLGQLSTVHHVRTHWHMFRWAIRNRKATEMLGQVWRIVGAATKTFAGLVPSGNTGGASVSGFRRMPIAADLQSIIDSVRA